MKAWIVGTPGPVDGAPLQLIDRPTPQPGPHEVRVRVSVCGVCRTDLHLAEGDLAPRRAEVVPGHEIVGVVDDTGEECARFDRGDRIGIGWLRSTCGTCRFCVRDDENLCVDPRFTGWDADGGYAEFELIDERYAYRLPDVFSDEEAAPLLCAGIIGFRALRRASLAPGGRLGIYGFGASAHLAAQLAMAAGATVHVMTRSPRAQDLAMSLGVASAGDTFDTPPEKLDSAVIFAPAGEIVPAALAALDRGGTLAIAGIHLSDIPPLRYQEHLFEERQLRSVTANTAAHALVDLAHDRVTGAAVIRIGGAEARTSDPPGDRRERRPFGRGN